MLFSRFSCVTLPRCSRGQHVPRRRSRALRTEVLQLVPLVRRRVEDDELVLVFACAAGRGRGQGCLGLRGKFAGRLDRERGGKAAVRDVHAGQLDAGDIGLIGLVPDVHIPVLDACRTGVPAEGRSVAEVLKPGSDRRQT